ncbi:hypothetical protein ACNAW0_02900 [Micromonospora sp. SL1-18]|uniref:hypothetical protein n=1 Tax=Micromonospora sp. SL1-18 TaxID=3399128 RepID=UPI003A4E5019
MVYVKLERDWTDAAGVAHSAGESVDVDAATLAKLQAQGTVSEGSGDGEESANWAGPTGATTDWAGPTGATTDWAGPTGTKS